MIDNDPTPGGYLTLSLSGRTNTADLFTQLALALLIASHLSSCTQSRSSADVGNPSEAPNSSQSASTSIKHSPVGSGRLVVFGDSLAAGTGSTSIDHHLSSCLSRKLNWSEVVTFAVPGLTSQQAIDLLPDLIALKPAAVLVSLGGNDVLREMSGQVFPQQQTFNHLTQIYSTLQSRGVMIVHMGLNPPSPAATRLAGIEPIARRLGVLFASSTMAQLWGNKTFMADDLHPNDLGYAIVCKRLAQVMKPHFN